MGGIGGLGALAAPDVGVHRSALDGPGPDDGHLHHEVRKGAGPDAGEGGHLGPALDLEHPDRVGPAQHVVDGVFLGEKSEIDIDPVCLAHQIHGSVQRIEHAQPEQVEFHEAHSGAVLLVPLKSTPPRHAGPFHGTDVDDRPVADDHPSGMDAEMAREVEDLLDQGGHL